MKQDNYYRLFEPGKSVKSPIFREDSDAPGSSQTLPVHQVDLILEDLCQMLQNFTAVIYECFLDWLTCLFLAGFSSLI